MKLKHKILGGLVSLGIATGLYLGISSEDKEYERLFEESKRPIVGIVLEENYQNTLSPVPEKHINGLVSQAYSNETVRLESKYTLKIQTDDGRILGVSIVDGRYNFYGGVSVKKESIDAIIDSAEEVGMDNASRISFPAGNRRHGNWFGGGEDRIYPNETYFTPETQAGNKRADRIKVFPK